MSTNHKIEIFHDIEEDEYSVHFKHKDFDDIYNTTYEDAIEEAESVKGVLKDHYRLPYVDIIEK